MKNSKSDVIKAGKWLAAERAGLGASTTLVARMATLLANRQGDPVRIHQQQISDIENATRDKGPQTLRPWFRYVRAAFESGLIADALGVGTGGPEKGEVDETFYIQNESGDIVGRLTWFARPRVSSAS